MKKLLGCFLCVMLLFCLAAPAGADILIMDIDGTTISDTSPYWTGSDTNGDVVSNSGQATEEWWISALRQIPTELPNEDTNGGDGWTYGQPYGFAVLKYADASSPVAPLGFDHWALYDDDGNGIVDLGIFAYNGGTVELTTQGLSHVRSTVPEPATLLLLGGGLVGLAGFGRKKFFKK